MKFVILSLGLSLTCSAWAQAQTKKNDNQLYISGTVGVYGFGGIDSDSDTLTTGGQAGIHVRGGYKFREYFGVEGEAGMGLGNISSNIDSDFGMDFQFAGYGLIRIPIGKRNRDRADLFVRAGYHFSEISIPTFAGTRNLSEDGVAYGFGGNYFFSDDLGVRIDIIGYNISDDVFSNTNDNSYVGGSVGIVKRF